MAKLHHFFIERPVDGGNAEPLSKKVGHELQLADPTLTHQLKHVFRFRECDRVVLLDNSGFQYVSSIASIDRDTVTFHIEEEQKSAAQASLRAVLFQSLIKKDKFEWIVEKTTELGVEGVVPVISERSEKKDINADRCKKIMKEASEQSERGTLPELYDVADLEEALSSADLQKQSDFFYVAFDPKGKIFDKAQVVAAMKSEKEPAMKLGILIGPEGGWSDKELESFKEKGVRVYSLGMQILKAETAAISAAALFLLAL